MTLRNSDLQSVSDLDSIRNSCDVFLLTVNLFNTKKAGKIESKSRRFIIVKDG